MKDRIRQLMEDQHLTQQNFAQMIGTSTATLSNIFTGKTNPSLGVVDGIHKSFPNVNISWVLYGTPPMYQNSGTEQGGNGASASGDALGADASLAVSDAFLATGTAGNGTSDESLVDFGTHQAVASPTSPSLFDQSQMHGVNRTPKNIANSAVKIIDKPQRKITEIRIFYDDQTWETFVPKKS